ncbi:hypothetical protein GCM10010304_63680 [Streptomyces roseoviolaceus]
MRLGVEADRGEALGLAGLPQQVLALGPLAQQDPGLEQYADAAAWVQAHLAADGEPEHVAAEVEATTKFYAPDPP